MSTQCSLSSQLINYQRLFSRLPSMSLGLPIRVSRQSQSQNPPERDELHDGDISLYVSLHSLLEEVLLMGRFLSYHQVNTTYSSIIESECDLVSKYGT